MATTRPSGTPLTPSESSFVLQELADVDERGRIHLLPRWTARVSWLHRALESSKGDIEALLVLSEPGRLSIKDWATEGLRVMRRYQEVSESIEESNLELLRLFQDRYQKLVIRQDRRPYLGDAALHHLELPISRLTKSVVYVAVFPEQIDLLGTSCRNRLLISGNSFLDDLP